MTTTRRDALKLIAASPLAAAPMAAAQSPAAAGRRIFSASQLMFVLEPGGTVKGWCYADAPGYAFGLGHSDRVKPYVAYDVPGLTGVTTLALSDFAVYALLANGRVMAWGGNPHGELGATPRSDVEVTAGGRATATSPIPVLDITDAIGISGGYHHALAVTRGGDVWAWGDNSRRQLGIEMPIINYKTHTPAAMSYLPFPLRVPGLTSVVAVAAGVDHSLALLSDGTIRGWGTNRDGQLGDGTAMDRMTPVPVVGVKNALAIAANQRLSAALLADGTVMTWGFGSNALGRPALKGGAPYPIPTLVPGVTNIQAIAMGGGHVVALTRRGTVISWGDQTVGERGHAGVGPGPIGGLTNVASVAASGGRTFAVLANGTIMTLGVVPFWARLGGDKGVATFPIPLVLKGLQNPAQPR